MNTTFKKLTGLLLSFAMVLGLLPATGYADGAELPVPVTTEGNTYSLFTGENLENQFGNTFLYVVERGGRYYTPAHPGSTGSYAALDSVAAIDITAYWDPETNTFSGIPDSANVGVMQYQSYTLPEYSTSGLFLDGNIMLSLSVPFDDSGETWFDGGICYYSSDNTYSYSRALWEATGDGSGYFYDSYFDWFGDKHEVHGVLALKGDDRFALLNCSEELAAEQPVNVNGYLYAAPCDHAILDYSAYVAPTCMDKGCKEYWYCIYCDTSFKDADCTSAYECRPVLPALDHDYGATGCVRCGKPVPVYTRITSYEQFKTVDPDASFIAVAELDNGSGGKDYYVLKKEIATTMADIDEDGQPDVLLVDDNGNGTADILETDANGDGVADAMDYDGIHNGEPDGLLDDDEIWEYLFYLEREYTDGYIPSLHTMTAIPVTPAADGTISVQGLEALEWIMERKYTDEVLEDQYYGDGATVKDYENDFRFRIPNYWIRSVVTIDNNFYQQPYDQGDSKWWGVLFGKDGKAMDGYLYEELYGADYPDDAAILYTEPFYSLNTDGQLEHALRFLVNGEKKNFIMTSDSFWEELEGTQYPIYLYCSDAGDEVHEHVFGAWISVSEENHKRICTVAGCTAYELASHGADENAERTPDADNYQLGHWVTCTECSGQYHEYHTREEAGRYYPSYWRDTGDGIHHVVYCTVCLGPVEYAEHDWSDWYNGNQEINGEWVRGHYRRCEDFPCEANEWRAECIYDEGVVTTEPTCTEPGIRTYTCTADPACELETKTYTEEIPALDHDWGDWTLLDSDPTREQRICKRDPNHTEERDAAVHEHNWGAWMPDGDENHTRTCSAEGCTARTETEAHDWDNGVITTQPTCTEPGTTTYTCPDCKATKTSPIPALDHDWGGWTYDSVDSHIRSCKRENCNAEEFGGHEWGNWISADGDTHKMTCSVCSGTQTDLHDWDNGVITKEPTCKETGVKTYTCQTCMHTRTEEVPAADHEFGDWTPNNDGTTHSRYCSCNESETANHKFDDGVVTEQPTHVEPGIKTYTCADCGYSYEEDIPVLTDHAWGEWVINKLDEANTHIRFCVCNESQTAPHNFDEGVVTTEATHTSKGVKTYTCTDDCGYSYTEEIPETPEHQWTDWSPNGDGTHTRACRCNANETKPCEWDDGVVTAPSCTEAGEKVYTCTVCGDTRTEPVPAPGHTFGPWEIQEDGSLRRSCTAENCDAYETAVPPSDRPLEELVVTGETQIAPGSDVTVELVGNGDNLADLINSAVSDAADIEAIRQGETISLYLQVEDISAAVAPTEAAAATAAASSADAEIGMYLDIDLFKQIANGEPMQVTETNGKVTITIRIPDDMINTDPAVTRTYSVVRVHDGWAEIIYGQFDPEAKTFTFETDRFSTYALAYGDETEVPTGGSSFAVTHLITVTGTQHGRLITSPIGSSAGGTVTLRVYPDKGYTLETLTVTDGSGAVIALTDLGSGKYTFAMPDSPVSVAATFMEDNTMLNYFVDVSPAEYYYDAVLWAAQKGITNGTSATTFSPDASCTRAQMVTFLWRAAGAPEPTGTACPFTDVDMDSYYGKAVLWAVENGITNGTSATTFSPDATCTRAQMAAFLSRMAKGEPTGSTNPFTDVQADAYYAKAVQWAVENGITNGTSETTFGPEETCTRAQMVTFLYRCFGK